MTRFSERYGYTEPRSMVQRTDLDNETRMDIWNVLALLSNVFSERGDEDQEDFMLELIWVWHLKRARDEMPSSVGVWRQVKSLILEKPFPQCMDTIEAVLDALHSVPRDWVKEWEETIDTAINSRLERNLVGFRLMNRRLSPFDREEEMEAVSEAMDAAGPGSSSAHHHLEQALALLSSRSSPDYRNSIKESISAVEAVARSLTGAQTLGAAIKQLPSVGISTHRALLSAWSAMYGWTSDAGGLRHGGEKVENPDQALAKYILVSCSAFVTLLLEEARKAAPAT